MSIFHGLCADFLWKLRSLGSAWQLLPWRVSVLCCDPCGPCGNTTFSWTQPPAWHLVDKPVDLDIWFQTFLVLPLNDPIWLVFFKWVEHLGGIPSRRKFRSIFSSIFSIEGRIYKFCIWWGPTIFQNSQLQNHFFCFLIVKPWTFSLPICFKAHLLGMPWGWFFVVSFSFPAKYVPQNRKKFQWPSKVAVAFGLLEWILDFLDHRHYDDVHPRARARQIQMENFFFGEIFCKLRPFFPQIPLLLIGFRSL